MISNDGWNDGCDLTSEDIIRNRIKAGLPVSEKDLLKIKEQPKNGEHETTSEKQDNKNISI